MYGDKGLVPKEEYTIPIGRVKIVHEGDDVINIFWKNDESS